MFKKFFEQSLLANSEYQQALVRLGIWLFCCFSMWFAIRTDHYSVDLPLLITLYSTFFTYFILLLISIVIWPKMPYRVDVDLIVDISATSLAIFLTSDAFSPFYLIYHWIYISYGIRYGARQLMIASILSFVTYSMLLIYLQQWQFHVLEAFVFVLLLLVIPVYQYILLRQLHKAKREAMLAKKARGNFLATMTHELRTPLVGVMGMARLLQNTPLDAEQKEYVQSINGSVRLLRSMISDVLDLSKIDANKLELSTEWFDVYELVKNISSSLASEAQGKRLEMYCWIDPEVPQQLYGDRLRVTQILFNMVGNAIKFTDQGYVCLRVLLAEANSEVSTSHILFEVEDSGIGIPEEKLAEIFNAYWQADDKNQHKRFEGAGLGTSVIRDLTRLMKGQVNVISNPGDGTKFSVRLPLLGEKPGIEAIQEAVPLAQRYPLLKDKKVMIYDQDPNAMQMHLQIVDELGMRALSANELNRFCRQLNQDLDFLLICDSFNDKAIKQVIRCVNTIEPSIPMILVGYRTENLSYASISTPVLIKPFLSMDLAQTVMDLLIPHQAQNSDIGDDSKQVNNSRAINVLLADDNVIASKVLETLLKQRGHQVKVTRNGKEALQAVNEKEYELAFVDLCMPDVDGIEFTRLYRERESKSRYMTIYALTANSVEDMMELCIRVGMDGFLTKPVEPEVLEGIIERHLNGRMDAKHWLPAPG
ncbi:MAG: ATP-binding protein [Candidatus Thiodiazotropha sp. DIVDIV]